MTERDPYAEQRKNMGLDDPTKFGIHDGYRVRAYNISSGGWITGGRYLCDACAHEHHSGQAALHNTPPGTLCQSRNHESNVLLANSGAEEPTEYEQYKDHPEVLGWLGDEFKRSEHTLCPSCAEDKRVTGASMDNYTPMHQRFVMDDDTCRDCGHRLASGRKEATRRTAISAEEEARLTDLPPLDLDRGTPGACGRCGGRLAPGEQGLCPQCESEGGGRKQRQRQKMVRTQGGGVERTGMLRVLDTIWKNARFDEWSWDPETQTSTHVPARDVAERKHRNYRGRSGYVPIANNTWMHKDTDGNTHIRHHNTDIVSFRDNGDITVDTGGWDSTTTKQRVNAFLPGNMQLMRNPSRARGAPERVLAHNPNGDSIYPSWRNHDGNWRDHPDRGKYGLHKDTILHPFEDGFTINQHTGEVHDNAVEAGELAAPPRARGFHPDNPPPGSGRPGRGYYSQPAGGHFMQTPGGGWGRVPSLEHRLRAPMYGDPGVDPSVRGEDSYSGDQYRYNPENISGGHSLYDPVHHPIESDDLPRHGESYDDWLNRTTKAPENVKCPTCKGRGDVRKTGPLPEGVNPWEHRKPCNDCGGEGLVPANRRISKRSSVIYDPEALSQVYLEGLRTLASMPSLPNPAQPRLANPDLAPPHRAAFQSTAYGETKAPTAVDTLREEACPVCGENDAFDGDQCAVCGFVTPPKMFQDPDLEKAKLLDLRANPADGAPNDQDPNVGQNLPPVDEDALDEEGEVPGEGDEPVDEDQVDEEGEVQPGAEGEEAGNVPDEEGVVEGDVRGLEDEGEPAEEEEGDPDQEPVDSDEVDDEGNVGGPEDPEAANKHFNQGGEAFTKGPNAPKPGEPLEEGEQVDGQEPEAEGGLPGTPGDGTADLLCPSCGFGADAAHPTSTPGNAAAPADAGDGMLAGDICPECQSATLMSTGEVEQAEQQLTGVK